MKQGVKSIFIISLLMNVLITIPALILLMYSSGIQYHLYQNILAPKLGRPEIAFIGDSITRDGGIWAFKIGEYNFNTWNFGHGGLTTRQLRLYGKRVANLRPKVAFVMAGINDEDKSLAGAHLSFGYYVEILDKLQEFGVEPIIQLTLYREEEQFVEFVETLNNKLREYAAEHNLSVIDLNPLLCPSQSLLPKYSRDGTHLTKAAYKIWSKEIRKTLNNKNL
ncbi:MAG: GDSL-type esterase/lipase family protein [Methylococcales bacterium]